MSKAIPERRPTNVPSEETLDEVTQAWDRYKADGAIEARDRLILHYSPLVKYVAGRVAVGLPANIEQSDLI
jgi:RNA polymerase sigma factor for flagellar operon FliA